MATRRTKHGKGKQVMAGEEASNGVRSRANIVKEKVRAPPLTVKAPGPLLDFLKATVTDTIVLDEALVKRLHESMRNTLYAKFPGKFPSLKTAKGWFSKLWHGLPGEYKVADMLNGYFFIRCSSEQLFETLLTNRPWTLNNGMVLYLIPWKPNFQPLLALLFRA